MNRKADFFLQNESIRITNRFDSHNESIRIANWNALLCTMMLHTSVGSLKFVCSLGLDFVVCMFIWRRLKVLCILVISRYRSCSRYPSFCNKCLLWFMDAGCIVCRRCLSNGQEVSTAVCLSGPWIDIGSNVQPVCCLLNARFCSDSNMSYSPFVRLDCIWYKRIQVLFKCLRYKNRLSPQ